MPGVFIIYTLGETVAHYNFLEFLLQTIEILKNIFVQTGIISQHESASSALFGFFYFYNMRLEYLHFIEYLFFADHTTQFLDVTLSFVWDWAVREEG